MKLIRLRPQFSGAFLCLISLGQTASAGDYASKLVDIIYYEDNALDMQYIAFEHSRSV